MKLLALLIGLLIERLATQLFHLRRQRSLDRLIDAGFRQSEKFATWPPLIPVTVLALLLVAPILLLRFGLGDMWFGFPYLILAVIVLFFSLGPKDIGEDVSEYCHAIEASDVERVLETARALAERDVPEDEDQRIRVVEEAVCIQANNRLFAVVFWFVLLGPVGAWAYRVTDLIRRRAVFNAMRADGTNNELTVAAAEKLHGWVAWIPARLTAIGYAMAGSFDGALSAWRDADNDDDVPLHEKSEQLLARVGTGALGLRREENESLAERAIRGAKAANGIVIRLFVIWAAVIGAMTLYGLSL